MKEKLKFKNMIYLYILLLALSDFLTFAGFEIVGSITIQILKSLYLFILLLTLISIYLEPTIDFKHLSTIAIFLIISPLPFRTYTLIAILTVYILRCLKHGFKVGLIIIYIPLIAFGIFGIILGEFGKTTNMYEIYSPDKKYKIVAIDSDQGALGGDTYLQLVRIYNPIIHRNIRELYYGPWGEKPTVKWLDNSNIIINNKKRLNIHKSESWNNKR